MDQIKYPFLDAISSQELAPTDGSVVALTVPDGTIAFAISVKDDVGFYFTEDGTTASSTNGHLLAKGFHGPLSMRKSQLALLKGVMGSDGSIFVTYYRSGAST